MRASWISAAIAFMLAATAAFPAFAYDPVGRWQVTNGESRYQVLFCQRDKLCAKLIWLRDDVKDPKARAYLNQYVVTEAVEVKPNLWTGALKYNGDVYQGQLTVNDDEHMSLKGCKVVFCQTFKLVRLHGAGR